VGTFLLLWRATHHRMSAARLCAAANEILSQSYQHAPHGSRGPEPYQPVFRASSPDRDHAHWAAALRRAGLAGRLDLVA